MMKTFNFSALVMSIAMVTMLSSSTVGAVARTDGSASQPAMAMNLTGGSSTSTTGTTLPTTLATPPYLPTTSTTNTSTTVKDSTQTDEQSCAVAEAMAKKNEIDLAPLNSQNSGANDPANPATGFEAIKNKMKSCFVSSSEIIDLGESLPTFGGDWGNISRQVQEQVKKRLLLEKERLLNRACDIASSTARAALEPVRRNLERYKDYVNTINNFDKVVADYGTELINKNLDEVVGSLHGYADDLDRTINNQVNKMNANDAEFNAKLGNITDKLSIDFSKDSNTQQNLQNVTKQAPVAPTETTQIAQPTQPTTSTQTKPTTVVQPVPPTGNTSSANNYYATTPTTAGTTPYSKP